MSGVKATDDAAFVSEVTQTLQETCEAMQRHNAAMLEEYLRRRATETKIALDEHLREQQAQLREAQTAAEARLARSEVALRRTQHQVGRAAEVLAWAHVRHAALQCFQAWRRHAERGTAARRAAGWLVSQSNARLLAHFYGRWRLHACLCRAVKGEKKTQQQCRTREAALLARLENAERELVIQRRRGGDLEAQLRLGFIRGVSALNREAVRTLRGPGADEDEVAEIEEILTKEGIGDDGGRGMGEAGTGLRAVPGPVVASRSHSAAPPRSPGDLVTATAAASSGGKRDNSSRHAASRTSLLSTAEAVSMGDRPSNICPVHHIDAEGNFYHRCYAPGVCRCARMDGRRGGAEGSAAHVPFVVCPDTKLARSYDAGPPLKLGLRPGSSRMRR